MMRMMMKSQRTAATVIMAQAGRRAKPRNQQQLGGQHVQLRRNPRLAGQQAAAEQLQVQARRRYVPRGCVRHVAGGSGGHVAKHSQAVRHVQVWDCTQLSEEHQRLVCFDA